MSLTPLTPSEFSMYREDNSIFVLNGVWFSDNINIPNFNSTIHTVFANSGRKPDIRVSHLQHRAVVRASITPVLVVVQGNHHLFQFEPPLPDSLQVSAFTERHEDQVMTGYRVEGFVEVVGMQMFIVTVCNEEGCVADELSIDVVGRLVPRE